MHDAIESLMDEPAKTAAPLSPNPAIRYPRWQSLPIDTRNRVRKVSSTVGSVAGGTGGMAATLAGAETGSVVAPMGTLFDVHSTLNYVSPMTFEKNWAAAQEREAA
ncbi:hypothetical protein [Burkholderia contaminans]|uniref:Uncharacterized protein n=1 Tax=Burkholderia contaminans TaxID=488447 RepID=A0A6P2Z9S8_9BURK|nr:hypothetical protein [Burkholderia contaminans]VWD31453.1 hypothetical protein BCO71171_03956 [Burkholderia contaminans]